jgi:hypothetical protein
VIQQSIKFFKLSIARGTGFDNIRLPFLPVRIEIVPLLLILEQ